MRLYKAQYVRTDDYEIDEFGFGEWGFGPGDAPEGWDDYSLGRWGEIREFFPPSDRPVYRSRSAAQARVDLINRWLGEGAAVLAEAEPVWVSVAEANANRARSRREARIGKLRAEIARLEAAA